MIVGHALRGLLQRAALFGRQAVKRHAQFIARQFQRCGTRQWQAIKLARVFQHGCVTALAHIGKDAGHGRFQLFVGSRLKCQQLNQLHIKIGLFCRESFDIHLPPIQLVIHAY